MPQWHKVSASVSWIICWAHPNFRFQVNLWFLSDEEWW